MYLLNEKLRNTRLITNLRGRPPPSSNMMASYILELDINHRDTAFDYEIERNLNHSWANEHTSWKIHWRNLLFFNVKSQSKRPEENGKTPFIYGGSWQLQWPCKFGSICCSRDGVCLSSTCIVVSIHIYIDLFFTLSPNPVSFAGHLTFSATWFSYLHWVVFHVSPNFVSFAGTWFFNQRDRGIDTWWSLKILIIFAFTNFCFKLPFICRVAKRCDDINDVLMRCHRRC